MRSATAKSLMSHCAESKTGAGLAAPELNCVRLPTASVWRQAGSVQAKWSESCQALAVHLVGGLSLCRIGRCSTPHFQGKA